MAADFPSTIKEKTQVKFKIGQSGLFAISVTASCKKRHDLRIEIDGRFLREIPPEKNIQKYNVPPAWNGIKLRGLNKTNIFVIKLTTGEHTLKFIPRHQATIKDWNYFQLENPQQIRFKFNQRAKNGNCRPWFTFALVDLPLQSISAQVSVNWHYFDGDDVKLIIDNEPLKNPNSKLWKYWAWHATPRQILKKTKTETKRVEQKLPAGIHYLEFWADKTPTLHQVTLDLGELELEFESTSTKKIPTKDDPGWTGDFSDDTETMILARLIFGEARSQSKETMTAIGWVVKNRVEAKKSYFGDGYHDVITKNDTVHWQFSPMNPEEEDNFPLLTDPLGNAETNKKAWSRAYEIAKNVINNKVQDPTDGATFFHSKNLSQEKFITESAPHAIYLKTMGYFRFYKDPNEN